MGGILWSKPTLEVNLDGLGFSSQVERDFDPNDSLEKLEQLLRASANTYRPSNLPPALVAAFYLGAFPEQLTFLFEKWVPEICTPWPAEDPVAESVGKFNLPEYYGLDSYELRFYEYFRDCFTEQPDWKKVVKNHSAMLWRRLSRNNYRPLVQLAAAAESSNDMTVSLALAMACADPEGLEAPIPDEPAKKQFDGASMALKLRELAIKALKTQSYEVVVPVHACVEIFLNPNGNVLTFESSWAILDSLDRYIASEGDKFEKLETLDNSDALFSEDWKLITYTRSRMVLEKIAI